MKKSTLLLFALVTVFMFSGCEIYSIVKDITDKEEGRITTTDGKVLTGRVEMPNANTKKLTIVTADKQKTVLNCENIKELVVWKKTHTDIKHVLQYLPSHKLTNPKKVRKPLWMTLLTSGPHLKIYACSFNYSIPSNGVLKISSVKGGDILYYALKEGETVPYGIYMTSNSKRAARERFQEYLSDDPVLCKKLQDAEINPLEYETIAQEYNPNR